MARWLAAALGVLVMSTACARRTGAPVEVLSAEVDLAPVVRPERITPVEPPRPPDLATAAEEAGCPLPLPSFVFETGSAVVSPAQALALHELARCLEQPPLQRAAVIVIGHADAVGPELYNLGLALERSQKVRAFLVANGVAGDRVLAASAGAESGRPGRRVDVYLTPATVIMPRIIQ